MCFDIKFFELGIENLKELNFFWTTSQKLGLAKKAMPKIFLLSSVCSNNEKT